MERDLADDDPAIESDVQQGGLTPTEVYPNITMFKLH